MEDAETSSSIKPPHQVLDSLPLLVFEYEDVCPDSRHEDDDEEEAPTGMLMYSLSQRRIYTGEMPEAMDAKKGNTCFSTPQGWVLVLGEVSDAWLWHPLSGDTITLPDDDHYYIPVNCKCLLTHSSAAHPDCAVVLLDVTDPVMWFCRVNGGSDQSWGQHTYDIGDYQLPEEFRTPSTSTKVIIPEVAVLG